MSRRTTAGKTMRRRATFICSLNTGKTSPRSPETWAVGPWASAATSSKITEPSWTWLSTLNDSWIINQIVNAADNQSASSDFGRRHHCWLQRLSLRVVINETYNYWFNLHRFKQSSCSQEVSSRSASPSLVFWRLKRLYVRSKSQLVPHRSIDRIALLFLSIIFSLLLKAFGVLSF